eukprot:TRINITY_DN16898_c0_g3_i1.p1 TRINITY_DN16898_c0_g3~~TRINITY_DN16898_c0_g3_i1.p1  ORF type:complete len:1716 (-),score=295.58 TRINITY_DN16898_c0_g3_i1:257-5404(-)
MSVDVFNAVVPVQPETSRLVGKVGLPFAPALRALLSKRLCSLLRAHRWRIFFLFMGLWHWLQRRRTEARARAAAAVAAASAIAGSPSAASPAAQSPSLLTPMVPVTPAATAAVAGAAASGARNSPGGVQTGRAAAISATPATVALTAGAPGAPALRDEEAPMTQGGTEEGRRASRRKTKEEAALGERQDLWEGPSTAELLVGRGNSFQSAGGLEWLLSMGLSAAGACISVRKAQVLGRLVAAQFHAAQIDATGRKALLQWVLRALEFPLLVLLQVSFSEIKASAQVLLAEKWRRNLTRKLHQMYFSKRAFYHLRQLPEDQAIHDANFRITCDVRDLTSGSAELAIGMPDAVLRTLVCGSALLAYRPGAKSFLASAPALFVLALQLKHFVEPIECARIHTTCENKEGTLRALAAKIEQHSGSVCALHGEGYEFEVLQSALSDVLHWVRKRRVATFFKSLIDVFDAQQATAALELVALFGATWIGIRDRDIALVDRLGRIFRDGCCFLSLCSGIAALVPMATLHRTSIHTTRVRQLYVRLDRLAKNLRVRRRSKSRADGDAESEAPTSTPFICLEGVRVQTPTQRELLRGLTFQVDPREMLLVCGPSGTGKTSVVRCLLDVWPITIGRLSKPLAKLGEVDAETAKPVVFYMPPVPYCPPGSLSDQVTYPLSVPGGLPAAQLRRMLEQAGIAHLIDIEFEDASRQRASESEGREPMPPPSWGERLSRAELQALGAARLLYHCPQFAVLDECLTALPAALEQQILRAAAHLGIGCLTIVDELSPDDPLLRQHAKLLLLTGTGTINGGWRLSALTMAASRRQRPGAAGRDRRPARKADADPHGRLEDLPAPPALPPCFRRGPGLMEAVALRGRHGLARETHLEVCSRWRSRSSRLRAVIRLGLTDPKRRKLLLLRLALSAGLLLVRTECYWLLCRGFGGMVRASLLRDGRGLLSQGLASGAVLFFAGLSDHAIKHQAAQLSTELWYSAAVYMLKQLLCRLAALRSAYARPAQHTGSGCNHELWVGYVKNPIQACVVELRVSFEALGPQLADVCVPLATLALLLPRAVIAAATSTTATSVAAAAGAVSAAIAAALGLTVASLALRWKFAPSAIASQEEAGRPLVTYHSRLLEFSEAAALGSAQALLHRSRSTADRLLEEELQKAREANRAEFRRRFAGALADAQQLPALGHRLLVLCLLRRCAPMLQLPAVGSGAEVAASAGVIAAVMLLDRVAQVSQAAMQGLARVLERSRRMDAQCQLILELVAGCDAVGWEAASGELLTACAAELAPPFQIQAKPGALAAPASSALAPSASACAAGSGASLTPSVGGLAESDSEGSIPDGEMPLSPMHGRSQRRRRSGGVSAGVDGTPFLKAIDLVVPGAVAPTPTADSGTSSPTLAAGLSFWVEPRIPTAILGPSASGKTLLGEALLGLWPQMSPHPRPPLKLIAPATQRVYLPSAQRLYVQLTYPRALRIPSRPPFAVRVERLPLDRSRDDLRELLTRHFAAFGATSLSFVQDHPAEAGTTSKGQQEELSAIVNFKTAHALMSAFRRPQDHVVEGLGELEIDCLGRRSGEESSAWGLPHLRRCMKAMGIDHLITRESDGWLARRPWETLLSEGEQQRLCLARVLYHRPTFALLDASTSALPPSAASDLYRRMYEDFGVTPIVVARRHVPLSLGTAGARSVVGVQLGVPSAASNWQRLPLQAVAPPLAAPQSFQGNG